MVDVGPRASRTARVVADVERLPFRRGALTGARSELTVAEVPAERLPMALAELHRATAPGAAVHVGVPRNAPTPLLREVVDWAGFEVVSAADHDAGVDFEATRARLLADTVGPGMRLLVVGLNPSGHTADAGYGYAGPGNRFWPAALASGLVSQGRDPFAALRDDRVGMTNLVRRVTPRAAQLGAEEYRAGAARLRRLVVWLRPSAVCFVGVTGYRLAVDRRARMGWQPEPFAGAPAYVMPNTSGLNAHAKPADFVEHLQAVQRRAAP
jgi:TDG/mug DNA glycosylase family protein